MPDLKNHKFDTSKYIHLQPLGILDAAFEKCAVLAEENAGCGEQSEYDQGREDAARAIAEKIRALKSI